MAKKVVAHIHMEYYSAVKKNALESTLKIKSINSSVLNFIYSPTLTSIYDYWEKKKKTKNKKHSFD